MRSDRPAPPMRPVCALGNNVGLTGYGDPVCYDHPNAIHNARCPEARRLARRRAVETAVMQVLSAAAILVIGVAAMLSIAVQACGLGGAC